MKDCIGRPTLEAIECNYKEIDRQLFISIINNKWWWYASGKNSPKLRKAQM